MRTGSATNPGRWWGGGRRRSGGCFQGRGTVCGCGRGGAGGNRAAAAFSSRGVVFVVPPPSRLIERLIEGGERGGVAGRGDRARRPGRASARGQSAARAPAARARRMRARTRRDWLASRAAGLPEWSSRAVGEAGTSRPVRCRFRARAERDWWPRWCCTARCALAGDHANVIARQLRNVCVRRRRPRGSFCAIWEARSMRPSNRKRTDRTLLVRWRRRPPDPRRLSANRN
jgi:hypothetical protein